MYLPLIIIFIRSTVFFNFIHMVFGNNVYRAAERSMELSNLFAGLKKVIGHNVRKVPAWNIVTVTKRIPVPYPVKLERRIPIRYEVRVDKPYPVFLPKPYPVIVWKKVRYQVNVPVPKPYPVVKHVPYPFKVEVEKPVPVEIPEPVPFLVEKHVPVYVENEVAFSPTSTTSDDSTISDRANGRNNSDDGVILQGDERHSANFNQFQQPPWDIEQVASSSASISDDGSYEDWQTMESSENTIATHNSYHGSGRKRELKQDEDDNSGQFNEPIDVEESNDNSVSRQKSTVTKKYNDKKSKVNKDIKKEFIE